MPNDSSMDPGILERVRTTHRESARRYKEVISQAASDEDAVRKLAHQDAMKAAQNFGLKGNKLKEMADYLDEHFNYNHGDGYGE